jgi:excisionase family DNA binding protein
MRSPPSAPDVRAGGADVGPPASPTLADLANLPALVRSMQARLTELETKLQPAPATELVDAVEAGRLLGMSAGAIRAAARRGTIPAVKVGRRVRFSRAALATTR